jgi:hypothetical protein
MFNLLFNFFKPKLKIYAIYQTHGGLWSKVVVYKKPKVYVEDYLVGPFRSEVDCEEFCDRENQTRCKHPIVSFYSQIK